MYILGFDIGGTKCAVVTALWNGKTINISKKKSIPTDHGVSAYQMLDRLFELADSLLDKTPDKIGISCGGPLDSAHGIIMSPPNLPGWDNIEIVRYIENHYNVPTKLQILCHKALTNQTDSSKYIGWTCNLPWGRSPPHNLPSSPLRAHNIPCEWNLQSEKSGSSLHLLHAFVIGCCRLTVAVKFADRFLNKRILKS